MFPTPHLRTETDPVSEALCSLEYRKMDKVQKTSNSENPDGLLLCSYDLTLDPVLSQMNPIQILTAYFCEIHFSIIILILQTKSILFSPRVFY
jgi:hypothetical protein